MFSTFSGLCTLFLFSLQEDHDEELALLKAAVFASMKEVSCDSESAQSKKKKNLAPYLATPWQFTATMSVLTTVHVCNNLHTECSQKYF